MQASLFYNVIGTVGASMILFGFYRTSIGKWKNKSFWYELDNTVGAVLLIIYQMQLKAYISVVLNIIWAIVAFRGLVSFAERRRKRRHK
jgi:hypothetical protein